MTVCFRGDLLWKFELRGFKCTVKACFSWLPMDWLLRQQFQGFLISGLLRKKNVLDSSSGFTGWSVTVLLEKNSSGSVAGWPVQSSTLFDMVKLVDQLRQAPRLPLTFFDQLKLCFETASQPVTSSYPARPAYEQPSFEAGYSWILQRGGVGDVIRVEILCLFLGFMLWQ